ncbi:nickel-dependent hydrogenase large subunit [Dasania phycosphaerae]
MSEQKSTDRLVVDPITRIEGHLRIEAEMDGNTIKQAYSSGTSVRGIERILQGRDPRDVWAFAQRICGVCTLVHGMASIRGVEHAIRSAWQSNAPLGVATGKHGPPGLSPMAASGPDGMSMPHPAMGRGPNKSGMKHGPPKGRGHAMASSAAPADMAIPPNAQLIRNLMIGTQFVHDHVMHFYHLHALDWVDVLSALKADPTKTAALAGSLSRYPRSSPGYFRDMQTKLKVFAESGQLGIFGNAYWGHPGYKLPPEVNLMALAHYLDALSWQRDVVKVHTIFGGKNPHPNFVVGGVPCPINLDADTGINTRRLAQLQEAITSMRTFVDQVYLPDILAIAGYYKEWGSRGEGLGNFLTVGDLPSNGMDDPSSFLFPRGVILNRDLSRVYDVDLTDPAEIQEFVSHSWYDYRGGKQQGLHPWSGETDLNYSGPAPPYKHLDVNNSYLWTLLGLQVKKTKNLSRLHISIRPCGYPLTQMTFARKHLIIQAVSNNQNCYQVLSTHGRCRFHLTYSAIKDCLLISTTANVFFFSHNSPKHSCLLCRVSHCYNVVRFVFSEFLYPFGVSPPSFGRH